jgi:CheY-like chemotaxis protein
MSDGKYILIVEDDETSRFLLETILNSYNKELLYAYNGKEAIQFVEKHKTNICLVLMDIELPELNGYDATKAIKTSYPKLPVIIQSAHALLEERIKAIVSGCDDFISKPLVKNQLYEVINKYLCVNGNELN